jgi:hypothetical protein
VHQSIEWTEAIGAVVGRGHARLARTVSADVCADLVAAAPSTWAPEPEVIGEVRQQKVSTGTYLYRAPEPVRRFAADLVNTLNGSRAGDVPPIPAFHEARWSRSRPGTGYAISAHRDPPLCGGMLAIVTLFGAARFRLGAGSGAVEWTTGDGDLLLLRGNGWPTDDAVCPVHEVDLPVDGDRMTLTFRHNRGGTGADYFAALRSDAS